MTIKNLLIIDDEELLLNNLSRILKKHATHVFTAPNAYEGHQILRNQEIHCVICDISMPGMTGVELIKKVREEENHIPFIFYTAHANHELMKEAAKYGAFDFLSKPHFEELEAVVARGLTEGFNRKEGDKGNPEGEYSRLLDEFIKAIKKDE
jgi:DNA-binding NtrC family response regulator